jgi:hypothetical protein
VRNRRSTISINGRLPGDRRTGIFQPFELDAGDAIEPGRNNAAVLRRTRSVLFYAAAPRP